MRIKVQHTDYLKRNGGRLAPRSPLVQCFWGSFLAATMEGKKCQIFADKSNFQNFFRNVVPFKASNWGANISSFVTTLGLEGFYLIHNSSPQEKQHLSHCPIVCFFFLFFFRLKTPLNVILCFSPLFILCGSLATQDKHQKRSPSLFISPRCPFCLRDQETQIHFFSNCLFATSFWNFMQATFRWLFNQIFIEINERISTLFSPLSLQVISSKRRKRHLS